MVDHLHLTDRMHSILLDQHTTFFCPGGRAHTKPFTVTTVSNRMLLICRLISGRWKKIQQITSEQEILHSKKLILINTSIFVYTA
jgi:hypothetical protein